VNYVIIQKTREYFPIFADEGFSLELFYIEAE